MINVYFSEFILFFLEFDKDERKIKEENKNVIINTICVYN